MKSVMLNNERFQEDIAKDQRDKGGACNVNDVGFPNQTLKPNQSRSSDHSKWEIAIAKISRGRFSYERNFEVMKDPIFAQFR